MIFPNTNWATLAGDKLKSPAKGEAEEIRGRGTEVIGDFGVGVLSF